MRTLIWSGLLASALLTGGCNNVRWLGDEHDASHVYGTTPADVAASLRSMQYALTGERREEFRFAVATLKMVASDTTDRRTVDGVTPQVAAMARGRTAEGIIRQADLWRAAAPPDRVRRVSRSSARER